MIIKVIIHAFPSGRKGEVSIKLSQRKDGRKNLSVKDNGIGLTEEINMHRPKSLGLQLIKDLTKQLKGELKVRRKNGTQFTLTF